MESHSKFLDYNSKWNNLSHEIHLSYYEHRWNTDYFNDEYFCLIQTKAEKIQEDHQRWI